MKKIIIIFTSIVFIVLIFGLTGCNKEMNINAYTRDPSSGTREGFFSAIDAKNAKKSNAYLIDEASEVTSNGDMINKVERDHYGIGYISLTSLEDTELKGLTYNNVEATEENVLNGTYRMARTFSFVSINEKTENISSDVITYVNEFNRFLNSIDGYTALISIGTIVEIPDDATNYTISDEALEIHKKGSIVEVNVGGSTSVESAAKALTNALSGKLTTFRALHAHTGSADSEKVVNSPADMQIGFSSSGRRDAWNDGEDKVTIGDLGKDAIVVVVNKNNEITNITTTELQQIYIKVGATYNGTLIANIENNLRKWNMLSSK